MSGIEWLVAASAATAAAGSVAQGVNAQRAANANATILKHNARRARELGAIEAQEIGEDRERAIGGFIAAQGASGFTLDGSALAVIGDLAARYSFEQSKARYDAAQRSAALRNEARGIEHQGRLSLIKGGFDAAGSLIEGAANVKAAGG